MCSFAVMSEARSIVLIRVGGVVTVCMFPKGNMGAVKQHGGDLNEHHSLVSRRFERRAGSQDFKGSLQITQLLQHRSSADVGV